MRRTQAQTVPTGKAGSVLPQDRTHAQNAMHCWTKPIQRSVSDTNITNATGKRRSIADAHGNPSGSFELLANAHNIADTNAVRSQTLTTSQTPAQVVST